jgi:hypothetical protein
MAAYKDPSFQERTALAQAAKLKALEKLKAKPPIDPAVLEARKVAAAAKEAAAIESRRVRAAALEQAKAEKLALAAAKAAAPQLTAAEQKAARDARYAARKNRK